MAQALQAGAARRSDPETESTSAPAAQGMARSQNVPTRISDMAPKKRGLSAIQWSNMKPITAMFPRGLGRVTPSSSSKNSLMGSDRQQWARRRENRVRDEAGARRRLRENVEKGGRRRVAPARANEHGKTSGNRRLADAGPGFRLARS